MWLQTPAPLALAGPFFFFFSCSVCGRKKRVIFKKKTQNLIYFLRVFWFFGHSLFFSRDSTAAAVFSRTRPSCVAGDRQPLTGLAGAGKKKKQKRKFWIPAQGEMQARTTQAALLLALWLVVASSAPEPKGAGGSYLFSLFLGFCAIAKLINFGADRLLLIMGDVGSDYARILYEALSGPPISLQVLVYKEPAASSSPIFTVSVCVSSLFFHTR